MVAPDQAAQRNLRAETCLSTDGSMHNCCLLDHSAALRHVLSFHLGQRPWPFQMWAASIRHHGPAFGLFCPRVSSEITVEVILCKYSRQALFAVPSPVSEARAVHGVLKTS